MESFAFQNAEGKRQRDIQTEMEIDERNIEYESYEMEWAGDSGNGEYFCRGQGCLVKKNEGLRFCFNEYLLISVLNEKKRLVAQKGS